MELPKIGTIEAFALIVDINLFTPMVSQSHCSNDSIAQFVRDVLAGGVDAVEKHGGSVVSFMGDAFLAIIDDPEKVFYACIGIAQDLDRLCEYLSSHQNNCPDAWEYAKGGPGLKIAIEYGWIDISTTESTLLGEQRLFVGPCINYANRISSAGEGNRCLIGPEAIDHGLNSWSHMGPYSVKGKHSEGDYVYWQMDLGDFWVEGKIEAGEETFHG
jgi:class 3 adenylate cyclase